MTRQPEINDPNDQQLGREGKTPPNSAAETEPGIVAAQYQVAAGVVGNIFSEYWQGNAFFMAFSTVGLGTLVVNWSKFVAIPPLAIVAIVLLFLFLLLIWLFTMLRHNFYLNVHMDHIVSIEEKEEGLNVYTHRRRAAAASRMPGARRVWMSVPVVFAIAVLITGVCALTGLGAEAGGRQGASGKVEQHK
jgi:hypothetical protein